MELNGTSALVTGGGRGLGLATARMLHASGAQVVLFSRDAERGRAAADEVCGRHVPGDIADPVAVQRACETAAEAAPLRSLVLCAGQGHAERTVGRDASFAAAHDLDAFRQMLEINLVGTFNSIRIGASAIARGPSLEDGARGAIVVTSSLAATGGQVGQAAYAASKAGLLGMLRPIARDLAPWGVRINAVTPAGMDTTMFGPDGADLALRERLGQAAIFPPRMGTPDEFASLAIELLTNNYLNCAVVPLDAGTTLLPR